MKKDLNTRFLIEVSKIKEPEIFLGVARILKVKLVSEEKDEEGRLISRDFSDILTDLIDSYSKSERRRKRELLKIIEKANKEVVDANRTKNSKESISNKEV